MKKSRVFFLLGLAAGLTVVFYMVGQRWTLQNELLRRDPELILNDPVLGPYALSRGQAIFAANCAACHGASAKGDPNLGVPDLTDHDFLYGQGHVAEIEEIVRYGIRAGDRRGRNFAYMPAYASERPYQTEPIPPLTPSEVSDVVEFLLRNHGRETDVAAAERGHVLYSAKAGCYDCHGPDGRGDPAIGAPNLLDTIWLYGDGSPESIADSIEHGRKGFSPAYAKTLDPVSMRAVAVFVASLPVRSTEVVQSR